MSEPGTTPFHRGGPAAMFAMEVKGPRDAVVVMAVQHRDLTDVAWSTAGSLAVLGPGRSSLRVSGFKEELRFRVSVGSDAGNGSAEVRVLPPVWLPQ